MSPKLKRSRKLDWIHTERVIPNENNPRSKQHFRKDELLALRASVEEHGILEPLLVQPYRDGPRDDRYLLLEGERRYTVAKDLGLKEIPAIITDRLDDHDQLLVMYHVHTQRRGWAMAEQLQTIKELMERNGDTPEDEMAKELGMSVATLRNRLQVLGMGDSVVTDIARDKLDYSSALRVKEVTSNLSKKRPDLVDSMGGEKVIVEKLLDKAKKRGGISQELVEAKKDLADVDEVSDEVVQKYIDEPKVTLRDLRKAQSSLAERRKAEGLARDLLRTEREIRAFDVELHDIPNLRHLRRALGALIDAAGDLETRVVDAVLAEDEEK